MDMGKYYLCEPIKANETLIELDKYKPLVSFDNRDEILKIKAFSPNSGLVLRLRVSNAGAMVELSKIWRDPEGVGMRFWRPKGKGLPSRGSASMSAARPPILKTMCRPSILLR